jgi:hypothetical protein
MWGARKAPHSDTRSPSLINKFRWRRDRLNPYTTRRVRVVSALEHEDHQCEAQFPVICPWRELDLTRMILASDRKGRDK